MMLITVPEAAKRVNRNPETIRRWIWSGRLRSQKFGNQHMVEDDELEEISSESRKFTWQEWLKELSELHQQLDTHNLPSAGEMIEEMRAARDREQEGWWS